MDYSKPETISLNDLKKRIISTDLVPSRSSLLEGIDVTFKKLEDQGINSWLDLQEAIKNPKHLEAFAAKSGIDQQYLVLLRREVEGYSPKPFDLKEIDWAPQEVITKLKENAISNSQILLTTFVETNIITTFAEQNGIDPRMMDYLFNLASLCRVQWVSPTTARMLIEAGYETCQKLSTADANALFVAMNQANKKGNYFKGTIGVRDIKRLIEAAKYCF